MLLAFRFQNFRSFRGKAELSLIPHTADKSLNSCLIEPKVTTGGLDGVLPVIAIYGANAAGKSNVLLALDYMYRAVIRSQPEWKPGTGTGISPFSSESAEEPSIFEVDIAINGVRFNYGFSGNQKHFIEEWLYAYPLGRERQLFYRKTSQIDGSLTTTVKFGKHFPGDEARDRQPIARRTRENSLFLSAAAQDNHPTARQIFGFFANYLTAGLPRHSQYFDEFMTGLGSFIASRDSNFSALLKRLMKLADPAIDDILISEGEGEHTNDFLSTGIDKVMDLPVEQLAETLSKFQVDFVLDTGDGKMKLPLSSESRGVQKLYALLPRVWLALRTGALVLVDELEANMHPLLARFLVDVFQNRETNQNGGQLIFATHDTNLLDRTLLRRDQIWFVEKHQSSSCLYSLLEFSPRKDENLELGYLRGRYGAIPALGLNPEWLRESSSMASNG